MNIKLGMVMDPIESIKTHKDSSFAMLLAAQARDWEIYYLQPHDLALRDGCCVARMHSIRVEDNPAAWYQVTGEKTMPLEYLDTVLMRKDPPFDMEYIYTSYILD